MTIEINLDDLTQAHIDRCAPNIGRCSYSAPCILGTLFDDKLGEDDEISVEELIHSGVISAPQDQLEEIVNLQSAFDASAVSCLASLLKMRGLEWPGGEKA